MVRCQYNLMYKTFFFQIVKKDIMVTIAMNPALPAHSVLNVVVGVFRSVLKKTVIISVDVQTI